MNSLPDSITIHETRNGIRKYYGKCSEHPRWVPGSTDSKPAARDRAQAHADQQHDGIDREGMPPELVTALAKVRDARTRRELARAARKWAGLRIYSNTEPVTTA